MIRDNDVKIAEEIMEDAPVRQLVPRLNQQLDPIKTQSAYPQYPDLPKESLVSFSELPENQRIAQASLWRALGNFFFS
jgi:hypothetical protein